MFDSVTNGKMATKTLLMIKRSAARQSYKNLEIGSTRLFKGEHNLADGISKIRCNEALTKILQTEIDNTSVGKWIHREVVQFDEQGTTGEVSNDT